MNDGKQEVQVLHSWLWVIIPVSNDNTPLLSGYCKACDTAFTRALPFRRTGELKLTKEIGVPKWGCVNPMEGLGVA